MSAADTKARAWSIACSVASVALPAMMLVYWRRYIAIHYEALDMPIEGKAVASGFMLLLPASALLCLTGLALGVIAYRKLPKPSPGSRMVELVLQALPLVLWWVFAWPLFRWVRG